MKKMSVVFLVLLILNSCSFIPFLSKNQPPFFFDSFIPMHQAEMVSYLDLQLNWDAKDPENEQLFYNVYFSRKSEPLKQLCKLHTETHYQLFFPLEAETKYHWKVTATDGRNAVESDTLVFETSYYFPDWWAQQNKDIYYFGVAAHARQRYSYSLAEENAEKNKHEFISKVVRDDMEVFLNEAAVFNETLLKMAEQIISIVAEHDFEQTKIDLHETKKVRQDYFRTYIRVTIPKEEYQKKLLSTIRSATYLYDELSFSQTFRQLDAEYH